VGEQRGDGRASEACVRATGGLLRVRLARLAFWVWAIASFVMACTLMLGHSYALPRPTTASPGLRAAIAEARAPADQGRWLVHHFVYGRCRCSQRVLASLFARKPLAGVAERVVLVGGQGAYERGAREAGFALDVIEPSALKTRFHLEAAPVLVVTDPAGEVRYVGGYTERKQGYALRDVEIVRALRAGRAEIELPLFGCAVSEQLARVLDPLGLRTPADAVQE